MKQIDKKYIILGSLCAIILTLTVAYAAFQSVLKIKGTSNITSEWNILITNVEEINKGGSAVTTEKEGIVNPSWNGLTANIEADLFQKGDYIEYEVTVENRGTLDAKLNEIKTNTTKEHEAILISFSGYTKGEKLEKGTSHKIIVRIEYNPEFEGIPEIGSKELNIELEYNQNDDYKKEENGEVSSPDRYLVTYDCTTNGGEKCTNYNEYLKEGENVNLNYITEKKGYNFIGWNTNKEAEEGLKEYTISAENTTLYAIFKLKEPPVINSINTNSTTSTITVVVSAYAEDSTIVKYEYSLDGEHWEESTDNVFTITNLNHNNEYTVLVKVTNADGLISEVANKVVKTNELEVPTFTIDEDNWADSKEVTINYNNDNLNYYYSYDGNEWIEANQIQKIVFNSEGTVIAKVTDGTNTILTSTYTVTKIDDSMPGEIIMYAGNTNPKGYLKCDGREVSRDTYSELFNIIGTTYGDGDGSTTFNLPDMQGKKVIGSSSKYKLGSTGGKTTAKITKVPKHSHQISQLTGTAESAGSHSHYVDPANQNAGTLLVSTSKTVPSAFGSRELYFKYGTGTWYSGWDKGHTDKTLEVGSHSHTFSTVANNTENNGAGSIFNIQNAYIEIGYYIKNNISKKDDSGYNNGNKSTRTGKMLIWPSNTIPEGYLLCDGRAVSRATYSELFNTIGTTYGDGDGSTTFNLPNTINRIVISGNNIGNIGGNNNISLSSENLPSHSHAVPALTGTTTSAGNHSHYFSESSVEAILIGKSSNQFDTASTNLGFVGNSGSGWFIGFGKGRSYNSSSAGAHTHKVTINQNKTQSSGSGNKFNVQNPYITEKYIIKY